MAIVTRFRITCYLNSTDASLALSFHLHTPCFLISTPMLSTMLMPIAYSCHHSFHFIVYNHSILSASMRNHADASMAAISKFENRESVGSIADQLRMFILSTPLPHTWSCYPFSRFRYSWSTIRSERTDSIIAFVAFVIRTESEELE